MDDTAARSGTNTATANGDAGEPHTGSIDCPMKQSRKRDQRVKIHFTEGEKRVIALFAEANSRSFASSVRWLTKEMLKAKGFGK